MEPCGQERLNTEECHYWDQRLYACVALPVLLTFVGRVLFLASWNRHSICSVVRRKALLAVGFLRAAAARHRHDREPVGKEVCQIRAKAAPKILSLLAVLFCFKSAYILFLPSEPQGASLWPTPAVRWTTLACFAGCTAYTLFPWLVRAETLNLFYAFFTAIGVVTMSPYHVPPALLTSRSLITLAALRLPVLILATRLWLVALGNLAFLAMIVARSQFEPGDDDTFQTAPQMECVVCISTLVIAVVLQALMKNRAELTIEQGNMATQLTAASSLLKLTCDAVVELDRSLLLTSHSPELAAMLLRDRPGSSLRGAKFTEFMPPAEAARATQLLAADSWETQRTDVGDKAFISAHAFHTKLVDSCSSKLCTEVFQVRYTRADGEICSLLGLREFTDATSLSGRNAMDAFPEQQRGDPISPTASLPISPWVSNSDDDMDDSLHSVSGPRRRQSFLDIDMEGVLVHAASAQLLPNVGMSVMQLFPAQHTVELLQRLYDEAMFVINRGEEPPKRLFSFKDLPVRWATSKTGRISGSMEVMCNRFGRVTVLMAFMEHTESASSVRTRASDKSEKASAASPGREVPALQAADKTTASL